MPTRNFSCEKRLENLLALSLGIIKSKFMVILSLALRIGQGEHRGALEVSQDANGIRTLAREQRLLNWD